MMAARAVALLVLCVAAALAGRGCALQFYLRSGHDQRRCFHDTAVPGTRVLGEYTVAAGAGDISVDLEVRTHDNTARLYYAQRIAHGKFAFVMPEGKAAPEIHHAEFHRRAHLPPADGRGADHAHADAHDLHADVHAMHDAHSDLQMPHVVHQAQMPHVVHQAHGYAHDTHANVHDAHSGHDVPHEIHQAHGDAHDAHAAGSDHHDAHEVHDHDLERHLSDPKLHDLRTAHEASDPAHHDAHYDHNVENHLGGHDMRDGHPDLAQLHADSHGEHGADLHKDLPDDIKDMWDMDDYGGLDEEALDEEERMAVDAMRKKEEGTNAHEHDEFGDDVMSNKEIESTFAEEKFTICVEGRGSSSAQRRVRLVIRKGESAMDVHRLAKKEHMNALEVQLRLISAELHDLLRQLERAHSMEEALRSINEKTNGAVVKYAGLSIFAMFAIGAMQARYTKVYFKQKKIA